MLPLSPGKYYKKKWAQLILKTYHPQCEPQPNPLVHPKHSHILSISNDLTSAFPSPLLLIIPAKEPKRQSQTKLFAQFNQTINIYLKIFVWYCVVTNKKKRYSKISFIKWFNLRLPEIFVIFFALYSRIFKTFIFLFCSTFISEKQESNFYFYFYLSCLFKQFF